MFKLTDFCLISPPQEIVIQKLIILRPHKIMAEKVLFSAAHIPHLRVVEITAIKTAHRNFERWIHLISLIRCLAELIMVFSKNSLIKLSNYFVDLIYFFQCWQRKRNL